MPLTRRRRACGSAGSAAPRQRLSDAVSRTRTDTSIGEPSKPNCSRSRRSRKRRYPCSRKPEAKTTKRGGRVAAWVAKRIRGCFRRGRVRVRGDDLAEEGVEPGGRDPGVPRVQSGLQRGDEPVEMPSGLRGDIDPRGPGHLAEVLLDLPVEVVPAVLVEQVPLVHRQDQRPTGVDDLADDSDVLLRQGLETSSSTTATSAFSIAAWVRSEA